MTTYIPICQAEFSTLKGDVKTAKADLGRNQKSYVDLKNKLQSIVSGVLTSKVNLNIPIDSVGHDDLPTNLNYSSDGEADLSPVESIKNITISDSSLIPGKMT